MRLGRCAWAGVLSLVACGQPTSVSSGAAGAPPQGSASPLAASAAPTASASASEVVAAAIVPPPPFTPHGSPGHFERSFDASVFQRGNLHTHTRESDGDSKPAKVIAWYRDHGYQFLAVTDHDKRLDPAKYRKLETHGFILIPGEEVTMAAAKKPVHVNALCHKAAVGGGRFPTVKKALAWAVSKIHEQGGIALVNHPNFDWALRGTDLAAAKGAELLEIWSGHPYVHTLGNKTHRSHEAMWDLALGTGLDFAGVAVDDTHHLSPAAPEPAARPGRGWVEVATPTLSIESICDALRKGDLYASSGAKIEHLVVRGDEMAVTVGESAKVEFFGQAGETLATIETSAAEPTATYHLRGGEQYVRARVTLPDGKQAWAPAFRVGE